MLILVNVMIMCTIDPIINNKVSVSVHSFPPMWLLIIHSDFQNCKNYFPAYTIPSLL